MNGDVKRYTVTRLQAAHDAALADLEAARQARMEAQREESRCRLIARTTEQRLVRAKYDYQQIPFKERLPELPKGRRNVGKRDPVSGNPASLVHHRMIYLLLLSRHYLTGRPLFNSRRGPSLSEELAAEMGGDYTPRKIRYSWEIGKKLHGLKVH